MNPRQAYEGFHTQVSLLRLDGQGSVGGIKSHWTRKREEGSDQPSDYELLEEDRWPHCLRGEWEKVGKVSNRGRGTREVDNGRINLPLPNLGVLR